MHPRRLGSQLLLVVGGRDGELFRDTARGRRRLFPRALPFGTYFILGISGFRL